MINANISSPKEDKEIFAEMVEAVFLFIHEHFREYSAILKDQDINYTQYITLITVYMYGVLSEGDLARMLFLNPSTVSRMVFSLERKGWLRCARDQDDRRKVMVSLSAAGKRRMSGMRERQADVVAKQVESLEEEQREYVHHAAEFVNQALRYITSSSADKASDA
jgi:DNA-binding MarR family transcriptional regulator